MYDSHKEYKKDIERVESLSSKTTNFSCPFLLDVYCKNGRTPLMIACANGNLAIAK